MHTWSSLIFFCSWAPRDCSSSILLRSWAISKSFLWNPVHHISVIVFLLGISYYRVSLLLIIHVVGPHYFLIFSSDCCLSFSRSMMDSWASFRSPSSFLLVLSRSMRSFFSCSREPSNCKIITHASNESTSRSTHQYC